MNSSSFATIHIAKSLKKADTQTKTCQRVGLPKRTGKLPTQIKQKNRAINELK